MAPQWIAMFCTLCGVIIGQECCSSGRACARGYQHCASVAYVSHSSPCRLVQKHCCEAAVQDGICAKGITAAKRPGACELSSFQGDLWEVKTAKMCCECCELGMLMQKEAHDCELPIALSTPCWATARACCQDGRRGPALLQLFLSVSLNNTGPGNGGNTESTHLCAGISRCSQLCIGNGSCACLQGYRLGSDGYSCEDYNECLAGVHSCSLGERCINTEGSYRCQRETSCGTGYELTDANACHDIDECAIGTHNCGPGFTCQNTPGSFRCHPQQQCGVGFIQDAVGSCIDINECVNEDNPCQSAHTCINTVGSYVCQRLSVSCGRGYHLNKEGTHCLDVDECGGRGKPCQGHSCVNVLGSFRCECRSGFTFNSISRACEDVDECMSYLARLCAHACENTPGSYQCSCRAGFRLASEGGNCEDVNECESNPCSQECANVYGSFQCYCRHGYQLSNADGVTCEDIDECALTSGGKVCSHHCFNTPGNFQCSCPPVAYTLSPNGRVCQDVDECATGAHTCSTTQSCFNIHGGFRCLSFECPPHFRRMADSRCERLPCRGNAACLSLPLRISYYNLTFPTNIPTPAAVFRMGPSMSVPVDDVQLAVVDGDTEGFFDVLKMPNGVMVYLQKPLDEPRDFLLTVEITLSRYSIVSRFIAKIAVFVVSGSPVVSQVVSEL
ncbi:fibulin-1 [Electrophorus electricus]|uniref:fibulin-1 n=1 Tax=Electrophorus electricus TaxID=8005 RepID=UPI0015D04FFE|nr:fibulin-1 [Electrophorus electricus]